MTICEEKYAICVKYLKTERKNDILYPNQMFLFKNAYRLYRRESSHI